MGRTTPLIKKTLCALCVSHYQLDILEEWFERWDSEIQRNMLPVEGAGPMAAFDLWHVEGPTHAFDELPDEFFAVQYLPLAAEAARRRISIS